MASKRRPAAAPAPGTPTRQKQLDYLEIDSIFAKNLGVTDGQKV